MKKIGIVHNPFAKGNLKRPWVGPRLKEMVEDVGVFRETRNIDELPRVAEEFRDRGIEVMAVNGGDGTLHLALTAFVHVYGEGGDLPAVMSLRGGTMNTMSNSLKIKGKTTTILERAVKRFKEGGEFHERDQHLIRVNEKYGFMSGAGYISNFLDAYYSGSSTGPWQAAKLLGRAAGSAVARTSFIKQIFTPVEAKVELEGQDLDGSEYTVILACTIRELGLGFTPTPRAYDKPGHFHLIAADIKPSQVVPKLPAVWLGRDLKHPAIKHSGTASKVVVTPLAGKMRWMIDGEMYDTDEPLRYSTGPVIKVIEP